MAMTRLALLLFAATVGLAHGAVAQTERPAAAALPSVKLPPELDRVLRDYEREWKAGSAPGLAALFVEDGFVLQPGRPPVHGRANIMAAYGSGGGPLVLRALAFSTSGNEGHIIGAFGVEPGGPDAGKFILLLRRGLDQKWMIVADMDNGNRGR